jgi:hypothetical protein
MFNSVDYRNILCDGWIKMLPMKEHTSSIFKVEGYQTKQSHNPESSNVKPKSFLYCTWHRLLAILLSTPYD